MRKQRFVTKTSSDELKKLSGSDLVTAINALKSNVKGNFDQTFECQVSLKLPPKSKNEVVRFSAMVPHSFTKEAKVLVLTDAQNSDIAKKAGADFVGLDDLVEKLMNGWVDFDVAIATPSVMPKIAKLGKVLGPKGLMPSPKNETVTEDLEKVIKNYKGGKMDFKMNETGLLSFKFGKMSMTEEELKENFDFIYDILQQEASKYGNNVIRKVFIKTTMSPSIKTAI
ncbi:50S ribosomal protein L1 [bacterium]|nr:MAG: 50S ribosomal protein L1 [bacterium]